MNLGRGVGLNDTLLNDCTESDKAYSYTLLYLSGETYILDKFRQYSVIFSIEEIFSLTNSNTCIDEPGTCAALLRNYPDTVFKPLCYIVIRIYSASNSSDPKFYFMFLTNKPSYRWKFSNCWSSLTKPISSSLAFWSDTIISDPGISF